MKKYLLPLIFFFSLQSCELLGFLGPDSDNPLPTGSGEWGSLIDAYLLDGGYAEDLALQGNYIYVAAKSGGVRVINKQSGQVVHHLSSADETWDVCIFQQTLFVADREGGTRIYNLSGVSDSVPPALLATISPGFSTVSLAVRSDRLVLAVGGGSGKIRLYDIANLSAPVPLAGEFSTPAGMNISSLGLHSNQVFAGDADGRLYSYDVTAPASPVQSDLYEATSIPGHSAWGLGITLNASGDRLYYSDWGAGFIILDISDVAQMKELGRFMTGDGVYDSYVVSDRAYLANGWGGLAVVDISDPQAMYLLGYEVIKHKVSKSGFDYSISGHGVWYEAGLVFLADNAAQSIALINVDEAPLAGLQPPAETSSSDNLPNQGTYSVGELIEYVDLGTAEDLLIQGSYAYVAAKDYGVYIIDISNPEIPVLLKTLNTSGTAWNLALSGDYLFVADKGNGITVIDINNPAQASIVKVIDPGIYVADLVVEGGWLYAGGGDGTDGYVKILDISDIQNPVVVGSYQVTGMYPACSSLGKNGDYLFYGAANGNLLALNITNPAGIILADTYYTPGTAGHEPWGLGITIDQTNSVLYYSDWGAGLAAVDITQPDNLTEMDIFYTGNGVYDAWLHGSELSVANSWGGVIVLDVSNPSALVQAGSTLEYAVSINSFDYPACPHGVVRSGNYTYIADNSSGALVVVYSGP